jgi:hypothetical protein
LGGQRVVGVVREFEPEESPQLAREHGPREGVLVQARIGLPERARHLVLDRAVDDDAVQPLVDLLKVRP